MKKEMLIILLPQNNQCLYGMFLSVYVRVCVIYTNSYVFFFQKLK